MRSFFPKGVHLRFPSTLLVPHCSPEFFGLFGGRWAVDGWGEGCPLFGSLNLFILLPNIANVYMCLYTKGILAPKKSYGFKNLEKLGPVRSETNRISGAVCSETNKISQGSSRRGAFFSSLHSILN